MAPKDSHPSDLTDAKWDRGATDGEIFLVIRDGAGPDMKMKGYKGRMTDNDMWNVVNYLRSVGPKK
jgi:mono/diheme cytochrome c family protein